MAKNNTALATVRKADAISVGDKGYARTATRLMIAGAVWDLWERLRREQGVDQQWLAGRLNKNKSRVSRLLKGPGNWTIDTVADLLEAMEGRLTVVDAKFYRDIAASSSIEPCLAALRDSGRLWNVIEVSFDSHDAVPTIGAGTTDTLEEREEMMILFTSTKSRPLLVDEEAQ